MTGGGNPCLYLGFCTIVDAYVCIITKESSMRECDTPLPPHLKGALEDQLFFRVMLVKRYDGFNAD